jgi:DNA-binding FrmR family transcriptional regulator
MTATMQNATTGELVTRLRKIEGQVRGLQHMIDRGDRCIEVLTQVAATRAALAAVGRGLLDCEIRRALVVGVDDTDRSVAEILAAVELLASR